VEHARGGRAEGDGERARPARVLTGRWLGSLARCTGVRAVDVTAGVTWRASGARAGGAARNVREGELVTGASARFKGTECGSAGPGGVRGLHAGGRKYRDFLYSNRKAEERLVYGERRRC